MKLAIPKLRSVIAVALILWCAGTGCVLVSYARAEMSDMDSFTPVAEHSMAGMNHSTDAHACCKAKHKKAGAPKHSVGVEGIQLTIPAPSRSDVMSCCPLTSGSMVVASRSQSNDNDSALNESSSSLLASTTSHPHPLAIPLRLPNRAHSYLLDCAFLI